MTLIYEKLGNISGICVRGQITSGNASVIESEMMSHIEKKNYDIILDLAELSYISSAGLRVVLLLAKKVKQHGGNLVLCRLQPKVREVFAVSGFLAILKVVDTRDEAIAAVGSLSTAGPDGLADPKSVRN
jgi:stage II sporulation protein AA (anti-sigma F factor antagonist)